MASRGSSEGLKSAYEAALEKLDSHGISRPDASALSEERRAAMAEARSKAEAELAQLQILHRDALRSTVDPAERAEAERRYGGEGRRIEERRERELERLRAE